MFRHCFVVIKFREYDTFTEILWNIKSRKKFFIGAMLKIENQLESSCQNFSTIKTCYEI